jgi:hypothetical protein
MAKNKIPTSDMALDDSQLLDTLLRPETNGLEFTAKSLIDTTDIWECLGMFARTMATIRAAKEKLAPLLGRLLLKIHDHPELYNDRGHKTFEAFVVWLKSEYGLSRTDSYDCMAIVRGYPDLPLEQYGRIGKARMRILVMFSKATDPSAAKYLQRAETMKLQDFRSWAEQQNLIEKGEDQGAVIVIPCCRQVEHFWKLVCRSPEVQAHIGSSDPGKILDACLAEAISTWAVHVYGGPTNQESDRYEVRQTDSNGASPALP